MPTKDLAQIKNKIISFLEENGPSLPAQIARHIETDMIFASAFLSELYSEKRIEITKMRVGSSPIYFLKEQKHKLEKYGSEYLKSKEKDAFEKLKNKRILNEEEQEPAIRVALKEIRDFAVPFNHEGKTYWKYFLEENPLEKISPEDKNLPEKKEKLGQRKEPIKEEKIIEKKEETKREKMPKKKKTTKKKTNSPKKDEKFFNSVKEFLKSRNQEIEDIVNFNKNELILKIKEENKEKIIVAFNKKRITENDISKIYKKISEFELEYNILSLGELAKKTENLIEALKKLDKIEKIE
jgi:hypothetical protein